MAPRPDWRGGALLGIYPRRTQEARGLCPGGDAQPSQNLLSVATGGVRANGEGQGQLPVPVTLREQNRDLGLPPGKTERNCKLTRVLSLPLCRDEPNENRPSGPEEIHLQTMHVQGETLARSLGGGLAQVPAIDSRFTRHFGQATGELRPVRAVTQQVLQGPILVQELPIGGQERDRFANQIE